MSEQWLPSASDQEDMQHWSKESELLTGEVGKEVIAIRARVAELEQAETERIEWVKRAERAEAVNEALREQLAALTYTWTTARPTVAGWYWVRIAPGHMELIERYDMSASGLAMWKDGMIYPIIGGEWAGPIPMPVEVPGR